MRKLDNAYWFKGIRHGIWFWGNEDINGKKKNAYSNKFGKEWHLKVEHKFHMLDLTDWNIFQVLNYENSSKT